MKSVAISGLQDPIDVQTRARVLDVLLAAKAKVQMACGGKGLCATCHVYVIAGASNVSPKTPREHMSLQMLREVQPSSRLACQAKVLGEGVQVALPEGTYLTSSKDLYTMIGRRAEARVLHPVDGRVLVETGKIITRGRIDELAQVDVDLNELRNRSETVA